MVLPHLRMATLNRSKGIWPEAGSLGERWGHVFMPGLTAMWGHCQLSMLNLCRPAVECHKCPLGLLDNHYIYYASYCQVLQNPHGLLSWLQVVPKEKLKNRWWTQQGREPAAYLKRAHHHNHRNIESICTKNVRGECMSGTVKRVQNQVLPACVPLLHQTAPLKHGMSWVPSSSPFLFRTPSLSSHLCCSSAKFTLGLPWAGCCLHISCGMCSFLGAWGLLCILMYRRGWHQPAPEHG